MKNIICGSLLCLAICVFVSSPALGQASLQNVAAIDDTPIQRSLLSEVRQLRLALQRANLIGYRAQILIERLRVQQDRVEQLSRELEQLRQEAVEEKLFDPQITEFAREQESQISREPDAARRNEMEASFKLMRYQLTQREQLRRERETALTMRMQAEQAKLAELNDRLDAVERELEAPRE
jgi:Na+-transporting NADH:ubiquinone oxidoreductase subunit NqrC